MEMKFTVEGTMTLKSGYVARITRPDSENKVLLGIGGGSYELTTEEAISLGNELARFGRGFVFTSNDTVPDDVTGAAGR